MHMADEFPRIEVIIFDTEQYRGWGQVPQLRFAVDDVRLYNVFDVDLLDFLNNDTFLFIPSKMTFSTTIREESC